MTDITPMPLPTPPANDSGVNPLAALRKQRDDLLGMINEIPNCLSVVGIIAPYFNLKAIAQDGFTDMSKIDATFLAEVGKDIIEHTKELKIRATELQQELTEYVTVTLENMMNQTIITEDMQALAAMESSFRAQTIADWMMQFNLGIIQMISLAVEHINRARPSDKQLEFNFDVTMETPHDE